MRRRLGKGHGRSPAREGGYSMLEVLVAGTLLFLALVGTSILTVAAARNSRFGAVDAEGASLATQLLSEYMSWSWQAINDERLAKGSDVIFEAEGLTASGTPSDAGPGRRYRARVEALVEGADAGMVESFRLRVTVEPENDLLGFTQRSVHEAFVVHP